MLYHECGSFTFREIPIHCRISRSHIPLSHVRIARARMEEKLDSCHVGLRILASYYKKNFTCTTQELMG